MTPANHSWLQFCRHQRPELTQAQFDALVPAFLRLGRRMVAARRRGGVQ